MSLTTASTFLYQASSESGTFSKVCDIIDYPDLGSAPTKIDTSTLSIEEGGMKTSTFGLQDAPDLTFTAMYELSQYEALKALEGTTTFFQIRFGDDGVDGCFGWSGKIVTYLTGGGVDEVRKMTLNISAETQIEVVDLVD